MQVIGTLIEHPTLSIEAKSCKRLPTWIKDAMEQAEASAEQPQLPVAVLHEDGSRYKDALVVMRLTDLKRRLWCECVDRRDKGRGEKPHS